VPASQTAARPSRLVARGSRGAAQAGVPAEPRGSGRALTLASAPQDLSRKDGLEAPGSGLGELPPASSKLSTSPSAVGTLKRPTSLSRHASAAGFPLTAAAPRAVPKGHKTPTSYSPMEGGEGPFIDTEDISQLLTDVARFADALENLRDVVLRDGEFRRAPRSRRPAAAHRRGDSAGASPPWGQSAPVGGGLCPGREGTGTPRGPCGAVAAVGRGVVGGCRELGAGITWLPACELFSSARFPVYSAVVPAACQGPQSPAGHRAWPPGPPTHQRSLHGAASGMGPMAWRGRGTGWAAGPWVGVPARGGEGSSGDLVVPAARWGCGGGVGGVT